MKTRTLKRLHDALESCRAVLRYTDGVDYATYLNDGLKRDAVERRLAIIGEALHHAARLDPTLADQLPELPQVLGLRHRVVHGYDAVDNVIVWDTVQAWLPSLQGRIENLLRENPPQ